MKAPQRNNRQRGSVLLVIVGVLAVMLIIAAAYMSQIEIDTASSIATSDYTEARLVAEGALQAVVAGLETDMRVPADTDKKLYSSNNGGVVQGLPAESVNNANESCDHLNDVILFPGTLFRNSAQPEDKEFPSSAISLGKLMTPPMGDTPGGHIIRGVDVYSRRHMYPDDTGGSPEYRRLKADVRIHMVDHAACLSFNHHGNTWDGGDQGVIMGADPQEVDLVTGLNALFFNSQDSSPVMQAIMDNYRSNAGNLETLPGTIFGPGGNGTRSYNPSMPLNGLLATFGLGDAQVWYPLKRGTYPASDSKRFTLEDELMLQRLRLTGRYLVDGQDPAQPNQWPSHLARELNKWNLNLENNSGVRNIMKLAACSMTTVSRTQAAGRLVEADGSMRWIEKIDINSLNTTDGSPDSEPGQNLKKLCLSVLEGKGDQAFNLAGSMAMFTSEYPDAAGQYPFGGSVNDWVTRAAVPVPHRLPVLGGYFFKFVKGQKDEPDKMALAVQILNPFDTRMPLPDCQ